MWRKTVDTSSNPEERCFLNMKKATEDWSSLSSSHAPWLHGMHTEIRAGIHAGIRAV